MIFNSLALEITLTKCRITFYAISLKTFAQNEEDHVNPAQEMVKYAI